jgi:hypothetical protein
MSKLLGIVYEQPGRRAKARFGPFEWSPAREALLYGGRLFDPEDLEDAAAFAAAHDETQKDYRYCGTGRLNLLRVRIFDRQPPPKPPPAAEEPTAAAPAPEPPSGADAAPEETGPVHEPMPPLAEGDPFGPETGSPAPAPAQAKPAASAVPDPFDAAALAGLAAAAPESPPAAAPRKRARK